MINRYGLTLSTAALIGTLLLCPWPTGASAETTADRAVAEVNKASSGTKQMRVRTLSRNGRVRSGFTFRFGLGGGYQTGEVDGQQLEEPAFAGYELGVGTFVSPWVAASLRLGGSYASPDSDFFDRVSVVALWGGAMDFWLADWLKLEAGLAFATHWVRSLDDSSKKPDLGIGVFSGLYFPFYQWNNHSFQLGLTYTPTFVRENVFHTSALSLSWQLL